MAILRKIKEKFNKIVKKKGKSPAKAATRKKTPKKEEVLNKAEKKFFGAQETAVEKAKFSTPSMPPVFAPRLVEDIPAAYGEDKIVLQVRDPWWIHSYWEVSSGTLERLKNKLGSLFFSARMILRVYDISHINFDGTNAHRSFDIEVGMHNNSWYIDAASPGRSWCVDIGLLLANGEFIRIARSNTVHTPLEGPSWVTDEEWMIPEDMFARLYGMGFGFGRTSPIGKAWQERLRRELFSGVLASPGITSASSPVKKAPQERKFWLIVNTELIVYGATEPDANVCVQGKQIKLRPDGTFTMRFALPDGKQVIPVEATSNDGIDKRTITPIVSKETK
ncbi:MAG: DUF4912 domain-containing protein [Candidatus Omnitrophica bacterium]|nr:DUF4912 domain-containing protein [Candidatus Omnitrophota bacterium]